MTKQQHHRLTAGVALFGATRDRADAMRTALRAADIAALMSTGLVGLSPYAQGYAQAEVERALGSVLDVDVLRQLVTVWTKHRQLEAARRRTSTTHSTELVELAVHDVTSIHPFHIDVLVDHTVRVRIESELALQARLTGLVATASKGQIVALHGGALVLSARLNLYGVTVAERQHRLTSDVLLAGSLDHTETLSVRRHDEGLVARGHAP